MSSWILIKPFGVHNPELHWCRVMTFVPDDNGNCFAQGCAKRREPITFLWGKDDEDPILPMEECNV
jgi:hypothetical protein